MNIVVTATPQCSGNSALMVAPSGKLMRQLGWKPKHLNLHEIIPSARK